MNRMQVSDGLTAFAWIFFFGCSGRRRIGLYSGASVGEATDGVDGRHENDHER